MSLVAIMHVLADKHLLNGVIHDVDSIDIWPTSTDIHEQTDACIAYTYSYTTIDNKTTHQHMHTHRHRHRHTDTHKHIQQAHKSHLDLAQTLEVTQFDH